MSGLFLLFLAAAAPAVEFIHITDTHVMRLEGVDSKLTAARRHYQHSAEALSAFLSRKPKTDFILCTGDLIDAFSFDGEDGREVRGQLERFRQAVRPAAAPLMLALGNHDIQRYRRDPAGTRPANDQSIAAEARRAWSRAFPCFRHGTFYSFEKTAGKTAYLFLVLDNGYAGRDAALSLADEQAAWVQRQLAGRPRHAVILVTHIPLREDRLSQAVRRAIGGSPRLAITIAGHRHIDEVGETEAGGRLVPQVLTGAFAISAENVRRFRLLEEKVEIGHSGTQGGVEREVDLMVAEPVAWLGRLRFWQFGD